MGPKAKTNKFGQIILDATIIKDHIKVRRLKLARQECNRLRATLKRIEQDAVVWHEDSLSKMRKMFRPNLTEKEKEHWAYLHGIVIQSACTLETLTGDADKACELLDRYRAKCLC